MIVTPYPGPAVRVAVDTHGIEGIGTERVSWFLAAGNALWPSANRAFYVPVSIASPCTITKLLIGVGTASGNVDVGLYDAAGNRLTSSGSTAVSGTNSDQLFNVADVTVGRGIYYLAMVVDTGVTATFWRLAPAAGLCQSTGVLMQDTAFPLPATATFAATTSAYIPRISALTGRTYP